jgi:hypothetical protein
MKKSIALIFVASTLFLAGCCTTHHVTSWEYKTGIMSDAELNTFVSQGWRIAYVLPNAAGNIEYVLKRPKQ